MLSLSAFLDSYTEGKNLLRRRSNGAGGNAMKWRQLGPWCMTSCRSSPLPGLVASVPSLPIKRAEPGSPEEGVHGLHTASHALHTDRRR